jgi:hypothetical protein
MNAYCILKSIVDLHKIQRDRELIIKVSAIESIKITVIVIILRIICCYTFINTKRKNI